MLIGHYAPAFLLQRLRPTVKLWHLFVAVQFVDVLWGLFILAGIEHARIVPGFTQSNDLDLWDMPYTHGLVATLVWGLAALGAWRFLARAPSRLGDAVVIAVAVVSHFATDYLVHVRDLPVLSTQGAKLGLGLWRDRTLALLVETSLVGASALFWWLPRDGRSGAAGAALLGMTALTAATFFIPTPPSPAAMALTGLATYGGFAAFAAWLDRSTRPT